MLARKRWFVAVAAVLMQLCLGTVYAWSIYKKPLMMKHGWTDTSVQVTFMLCIATLGLAAAFGGALLERRGPRFVATAGGILFGIGTLLAGLADLAGSQWLLYLGFGLIGGTGIGLAYITPLTTLIRWFPDKRGLMTGLVMMGFGAGAFFMGTIGPGMIQKLGVGNTFFVWGAIYLVVISTASTVFRFPPPDWVPPGFTPPRGQVSDHASYTFDKAVKTRQWWMLWGILFLNISAGIGLISQLSPMIQEIMIRNAGGIVLAQMSVAAGVILGYTSIAGGIGRLLWAWLSDWIGRRSVFILVLGSGIILYLILPGVKTTWLFGLIAGYLMTCYGAGFSVMPAFAADAFGSAHVGRVYGMMLTAWSLAGVTGPLIFSQIPGVALFVAAALLSAGLILVLLYRPPAALN